MTVCYGDDDDVDGWQVQKSLKRLLLQAHLRLGGSGSRLVVGQH